MGDKPLFGTLPVRASNLAGGWDELYIFLVWLSVFFFVLVVGLTVYFIVRYRKSKNPEPTSHAHHHLLLEITWTAIPLVLVMIIFAWGYLDYRNMVHAPKDAYEINVVGKQWLWQFQYPHGQSTIGELYVPLNKPVKLKMTADDVLHSFFVPQFRVKQDVVPGMYTYVWFEATKPGEFDIFCTEYCGTGHSAMLGKVFVLEDYKWDLWLAGQLGAGDAMAMAAKDPVAAGADVYKGKGCNACHSVDGSVGIGPSFKGLYGKTEQFIDGSSAIVDDNYIRESTENPQAKVVKGFNPVMPTFKGLLKEEELNAMIAYIKSLK